MLFRIKNWLYRRRYPEHMKRLWSLRDKAKQQHRKMPDLRSAMNELLRKELNT